MDLFRNYRRWGVALFVILCCAPAWSDHDGNLRSSIAWQIALDRLGFSPGIIDGRIGSKTRLAARELQRVLGLPVTGDLDAATATALKIDPDQAITTYVIQPEDLHRIGPVPKTWTEKSRLPRLDYESLEAAIAEKFHCSRTLLRQLNPRANMAQTKTGDRVFVPAVLSVNDGARGEQVSIDLTEKVIRVLSRDRRIVGLFHCSIAAEHEKRPQRNAAVQVITDNPSYTFDPAMWPEVKDVDRKLLIPPGPRNPVGVCWIGLTLPGYGIHGTPNPELIGKTGSHGCFRLTNWDATRLARMVRVGTPVHFTG